jgi:hypothetical protein
MSDEEIFCFAMAAVIVVLGFIGMYATTSQSYVLHRKTFCPECGERMELEEPLEFDHRTGKPRKPYRKICPSGCSHRCFGSCICRVCGLMLD